MGDNSQHSAPRRFDHLWSGNELNAAHDACMALIENFGERPDGTVNPWPTDPEKVAKTAFLAGWIAAKGHP